MILNKLTVTAKVI